MKQYFAFILMILGAFCASSIIPISLLYPGQDPYSLVLVSSIIAALFHVPFIMRNRKFSSLLPEKGDLFFRFSFLGGAFVTIGYALFSSSLILAVNPYLPTVLFELYPLGIILLSSLIIRSEKFDPHTISWLIIGSLGIAIILFGQNITNGSSFQWDKGSVFLSLLAVLFLSFGACFVTLAIKKHRSKSNLQSALTASFYARLGGSAALLPFVFINGFSIDFTNQGILYIFLYGLILLGLTNILYYSAISLSKSSLINTVWYMTPVFGIIWLFTLGESGFNGFIATGATLIIISNIMLNLNANLKKLKDSTKK
jgi:drug/metabolite transporter (DMT)-like permease